MYHAEMFEDKVASSAHRLGDGLFSAAYRLSNGLVAKVGKNDGTRNWLEFCMLMREQGSLMPLMPEVYQVVPLEDHMYMAVMPEYTHGNYAHEAGLVTTFGGWELRMALPAEWLNVLGAYRLYMEMLRPTTSWEDWELFNDMHTGNTMYSEERGWIITDPSATGYVKQAEPAFELH